MKKTKRQKESRGSRKYKWKQGEERHGTRMHGNFPPWHTHPLYIIITIIIIITTIIIQSIICSPQFSTVTYLLHPPVGWQTQPAHPVRHFGEDAGSYDDDDYDEDDGDDDVCMYMCVCVSSSSSWPFFPSLWIPPAIMPPHILTRSHFSPFHPSPSKPPILSPPKPPHAPVHTNH